jgi:hypothetical protein
MTRGGAGTVPTARIAVASLAFAFALPLRAAETFDIGLATSGARIDAVAAEARGDPARTVLLVGGLEGNDASVAAVRDAVEAFERSRNRRVRLLAVPLANPDGAALEFPPTGIAYREHSESHALWRWIGTQAPDLVLIAGDDAGLAAALGEHAAADVGRIPARRWSGSRELDELGDIPRSEAGLEIERRRARSPRQVAQELATHYGRDFDQPWYIGAIALIARIRLGDVDDVRRLV